MEYLIILDVILVNGIQIVAFVLYPYYSKNFRETVGEEGAESRWALVSYYGTGTVLIRGNVRYNKKVGLTSATGLLECSPLRCR